MKLTENSQATVLLTVPFNQIGKYKSNDKLAQCLSINEWNSLASWLRRQELEPSILLQPNFESYLKGWKHAAISMDRIGKLLNRGVAFGLKLEKWNRAGISIITRSDKDYPVKYKKLLREKSPPVLFVCGNHHLLKSGGVAVVGPRDAANEDLAYSELLGKELAARKLTVISGGARGIDQRAMFGALDNGGKIVGVLAENLLNSVSSAKYCKHIRDGNLVLVSATSPEAKFNVGYALVRNTYIYCLADSSVVVNCIPCKGGTWHGANENLKHKWVPLWVKRNDNRDSGIKELVQRGACCIPNNLSSWDPLQAPMPL